MCTRECLCVLCTVRMRKKKVILDEISRTFILESVHPESFTTGSAVQVKPLEKIHPLPSGEYGLLLNCG